jgi:hypothetical protein
MSKDKIRALCARIALELDPAKNDVLIAQLKRLLDGEEIILLSQTQEERDGSINRILTERYTKMPEQ